jgi:PHS family inorganic phosphate transporter-like MFS transporter
VWRIALGFGALPPLGFAYFRFKRHITSASDQAAASPTFARVDENKTIKTEEITQESRWSLVMKHKWTLVGTALTWLLLDITFYANGLFKETVVDILGLAGGTTPAQKVLNTALASLSMAGIALPGYWVTIALIDRIGRRTIQIIGFVAISAIFVVLGAAYQHIIKYPALFFVIYGLTFFFSNFGPNTTTYIVPGEAFPVSIRSTCHGISAASGKIGAVIGVSVFPYLEPYGLSTIFFACAGVALLGLIVTLIFVPETKGLDLNELNAGKVMYGYATGALNKRSEVASA